MWLMCTMLKGEHWSFFWPCCVETAHQLDSKHFTPLNTPCQCQWFCTEIIWKASVQFLFSSKFNFVDITIISKQFKVLSKQIFYPLQGLLVHLGVIFPKCCFGIIPMSWIWPKGFAWIPYLCFINCIYNDSKIFFYCVQLGNVFEFYHTRIAFPVNTFPVNIPVFLSSIVCQVVQKLIKFNSSSCLQLLFCWK